MAPIEKLAVRLKKLREERNWTQERLAQRAHLSRVYIARLETARQDPTLSTLEKIAKALGVKVEALLR